MIFRASGSARWSMTSLLTLAVCACALLSACGIIQASVDGQRAFSRQLASDISGEISAIFTLRGESPVVDSLCISKDEARQCTFARAPSNLLPCPYFTGIEDCLAIVLRASTLDDPLVRTLIEETTADYCAYVRGDRYSNSAEVVRSIGCSQPSGGFEEYYRGHPTVCVLAVDSLDAVAQRFAVRGGRRVRSRWCDEVEP